MKKNSSLDKILIKDILFVPNLLSLSRIVASVLFIYSLNLGGEKRFWYALFILFYIIFTDIFDGYLSRLLNQISGLGKILDPLADKIATLFMGYGLVMYASFPLDYFITLILRDLLIFFVGYMFYKSTKTIPIANAWGKAHTINVSIFIGVCLLNNNQVSFSVQGLWIFFLSLGWILTIVSSLFYIQLVLERLKNKLY